MLVNLLGYVLDMINAIWHFILFALARWYVSLPILIGIVLLPFVIRFVCALVSRIIFSVKLNLTVKKQGGTCKLLRLPVASLLVNNSKNDAEIVLDGQSYIIKFFPKNVKSRNVYLFNLKKAFVSRPTAQNVVGRWSGQFGGDFIFNYDEGEKRAFEIKITPNANSKNILLFQSTPYNVYALNKNGYKTVGSGEEFEGMTLYVGNEFIKYINR